MYLRGRQPLRLRLLQPQSLVSQQHAPLFCKASFTALSLCVPLSVCLLVRIHTINVFHVKNTENLRTVAHLGYQHVSFSSTRPLFCKASFTAILLCVPLSACLLVRRHTITVYFMLRYRKIVDINPCFILKLVSNTHHLSVRLASLRSHSVPVSTFCMSASQKTHS